MKLEHNLLYLKAKIKVIFNINTFEKQIQFVYFVEL